MMAETAKFPECYSPHTRESSTWRAPKLHNAIAPPGAKLRPRLGEVWPMIGVGGSVLATCG